ncbi:MAG: hypothetical protein EXR73_01245 [Myxococcales bacterium]|nr:hypothetical protein [Myxococcales bacterium]
MLQTFLSSSIRGHFGEIVVGMGDVDADGVPDFAIDAALHREAGTPILGRVELVSGATGAVIGSFTRNDNGVDPIVALCNAGDFDLDGVDDLCIVEHAGLTTIELRVRVIAGATLAKLLDENVVPPGGDMTGASVAQIGDLDGDGRAELLVAGRSTALFGAWGAAIAYSPATRAPLFSLVDLNGEFGQSCTGVGDVDLDGTDDFAISRNSGIDGGTVDLWSGATHAVLLSIEQNFLHLGASMDGSVDLDGDGIRELLVGATPLDVDRSAGEAQVRSLVTGNLMRRHVAKKEPETFGGGACLFDDVDGDGIAEVLAGFSDHLDRVEFVVVLAGADGKELQRFAAASQDFGGTLRCVPDVDSDGQSDFAVAGTVVDLSSVEVRSSNSGALIRAFTDTNPGIGFGRALAVGKQPSGAV